MGLKSYTKVILMMLRYCLTEDGFSLRAKYAAYLSTVTFEIGTGRMFNCSQKA